MSRGVGIVVGVGISSFFPLTSSIIKFFHHPSNIFHLTDCEELVKVLTHRCKKLDENEDKDGKKK